MKVYSAILMLAFLFAIEAHAETRTIVFPVDGETTFRDDFLEPRDGGAREHLGNDILADKMTPLVAAVDGVISYIPYPEPSWGYMITIQDKDRYQYRYIHINNDTPGTDDGNGGRENAYAPGLKRGSEVKAGQLIGWVGDSGNAENTVSHLHFEIRTPSRTAINPYPSLIAAASPENYQKEYVEHEHVSAGEAGVEEGAAFIFTIDLMLGMKGEAIQELQKRLKESGHFTLSYTTTYFGEVTKTAVQAYQRANGIAPTGVVNFETRSILNGDPISTGGKLRLEKELFEGDSGEQVLQVQLKLETLGYFEGEANGEYGWETREAVRAFQNAEGLTPTGYVNYDTWNKLTSVYRVNPGATTESTAETESTTNGYVFTTTMVIGSSGDDVVQLQKKLQELGHFSLSVSTTGYFGPITDEAVKSFQSANGIEAIGIVGPKTRAALNAA